MSRIGKIPVKLPQGVKASFSNNIMTVEGPKGKLSREYHSVISFESKDGAVFVARQNDEKQTRAYHGLYRNLLNNMVTGVSQGWSRTLEINGVGYRAEVKGKLLIMNLGFSNEVYIGIPEGITVTVEQNVKMVFSGINREELGEFAAQVRSLRPPEPYKGKGIKYAEEHIRRKVGKSGVK